MLTFLILVVAAIIVGLIIRQGNRITILEEEIREVFIQLREFRRERKESVTPAEPKKEEPTEKIQDENFAASKKRVVFEELPILEEPPPPIVVEEKKEELIVNTEVTLPVIEEKKKEEEIISPPVEAPQEIFTPKPHRTNAEWEALIGGKILNRIGALALIIGTGFFLKYAVDNDWITQTMRVIIGFAAGLALLFGGHYYHRKNFRVFSQGLVGAGIAILYLSAYASFNYYHLDYVTQTVAMLMMSAVTVITFTQAFKYDSIVIALFGWLGGFLTPILLSTGHANETGFFTYISILDAGLLIIVMRKEKWRVLEPLTLAATILMYVAWRIDNLSEDNVWTTMVFLTIFWVLFLAMELIRIYRREKNIDILHQLISAGNAVFYFLAAYDVIDPYHHSLTAPFTVFLAAVYFGVYLFALKYRSDDEPLLIRYLLSAILLSVIASAIQYRNFDLNIAWTLEALALALLATRFRNTFVTGCAFVLFALSFLYFFSVQNALQLPPKEFHLLWNERSLALGVMMVSATLAAIYKTKPATFISAAAGVSGNDSSVELPPVSGEENSSQPEWSVSREANWVLQFFNAGILTTIYTCGAVLFLFMIVTLETKDYMLQLMTNAQASHSMFYWENIPFVLCIEWMLLSLPLLFFGFRKNNPSVFICGIILASITFPYLAISAIAEQLNAETFVSVFNFRTLALLFTAGCFFIEAKWMERRNFYDWFSKFVYALRMMMVILIFIFLTTETSDYFNRLIANAVEQRAQFYSNYLPFILCIEWTLLSMPLLFFGLRKNIAPYVDSGLILSGIVFLFAASKVLVVHLQPETFVPVFNIRALALVLASLCLFIQVRWISKKEFYPWFPIALYLMRVMMVILIFSFITSETCDYFNKLGANATPLQFSFYSENLPYVLSTEWMALSITLLFFGFRKETTAFIHCSLLLILMAFVTCCGALLMQHVQVETFTPFFNFRTLALLFTSLCLYVQARWMEKKEFYPWFPIAQYVMRVMMVILIFGFLTSETSDYFNKLSANATPVQFTFYSENLPYLLCTEWMALSLALLFFGLRKEIVAFIHCSLLLIVIALASCGAALVMHNIQIETFIPLFNFRTLALLFSSLCLYMQARWMEKKEFYPWFPIAINVMRVTLVTLGFIFITAETFDVFEKKIFNSGEAGKAGSPLVKNLRNLQQLCISGAWLFYSMLLMVIGIYRSRFNIRVVSIVVFGLTISKVFFYDLSYLDTLHRIFSFIALGVILLLVSYLYQKFKHLILPDKRV